MRSFIFIMVFAAFHSQAEDPVAKPYPVREIPTDSKRFDQIYETVATQELAAAMPKSIPLKIMQSVKASYYLVTVEDSILGLSVPEDTRTLVDDETVQLPVRYTGEVFQYTSVLGATKTVREIEVAPIPKKITKAEFILALQNGSKFTIQKGEAKDNCSACGGFGGSTLNKTTCRNCSGRGHFMRKLYFDVIW